jgi:CheY-like chemotaxis protein
MQQVIWNLLSNAIKFTPEGGCVGLTLRQEGEALVIRVTDSGIGISPEFLPYVFERFRQQDGANTRQFGGLGLGLAIVRHITELHGGTVTAESPGEGGGATFTVRVPIAPARAPQIEDAGGENEADASRMNELPRLDGAHVLVVENEPDARLLIKAVLENCGARVTVTDSAAAALAALDREHPDVLLSDIAMPIEDGYALIARIRALPDARRLLPAAALTAFATAADRTRALLAGFQAHVPKPVEPAELAAVVASLLDRRKQPASV